ncbi:MAG: glycosyltransferase, partial [Candidatus Dadabacteria bacterium]|nr:glycosyltransferase [Candidatus Dadabacteria bacterium]
MPQPILSVCIITYNHSLFIKQAVESVITQKTNYPFEIIIADDNSVDGTTDIVTEYQRLYPERI